MQFITAKNLEVGQVSFNKWLLKRESIHTMLHCSEIKEMKWVGSDVQPVVLSPGGWGRRPRVHCHHSQGTNTLTQWHGWSSIPCSEKGVGRHPPDNPEHPSLVLWNSRAQNSVILTENRGWAWRGRKWSRLTREERDVLHLDWGVPYRYLELPNYANYFT